MAQLIYIGNLAVMDTNEGNYTNENPSAVQGLYGAGDMTVTDVTMSDNTVSGITYDDDGPHGNPADTFTYDLGGGTVTSALDGQARFDGSVRDAGGTYHHVTLSVYQLQNGDTFVRLPHGHTINQLAIRAMVGDGYGNIKTGASSTSTVVCFVAGALIATPEGPRPVESLRVGDRVLTLDNGAQCVRWHHRWTTRTTERTAPVRILAGALGQDMPDTDLRVSPQHRMLIRSAIVRRMFGVGEVLVPAKGLIGNPGVAQDFGQDRVDYVHFMCDRHEIVLANGAPTETLYPGPEARKVLVGLLHGTAPADGGTAPARILPKGRQARHLAARHAKNGKPLIEARTA